MHQLNVQPFVFEQKIKLAPVIAGRLHHDQAHVLVQQVFSQSFDLVRHRRPGRDLLACSAALARGAHASLRIPFGNIQPCAPLIENIHCFTIRFAAVE
jgi:hypothetical protein